MKIYLNLFLACMLFVSCGNEKNNSKEATETISKKEITTSIYPESITKVFDAHGGIDTWRKMTALSFTIPKNNDKEITTLNLRSRAELIKTNNYTLGFDGEKQWLLEENEGAYKGNAKFYKGLMFYFYAMPFVVGDAGIIYEDIEPLQFEGVNYPGILISYEAGTGVSPDDQYKIYFNEDTGKMEWLGYTVTFGKDGKSDDFHFIRYNNWQEINGLMLPKSIDWYSYENNKPLEKRNTVLFEDVKLSNKALDKQMFKKPEKAKIIE